MKRVVLYVIGLVIFSVITGNSQITELDSLVIESEKHKNDTNKVLLLLKIGSEYQYIGNFANASKFGINALKLSDEINFSKGVANSYNLLGNVQMNIGQYDSALVFQNKALAIRRKNNDLRGLASSYGNIGLLYYYKSDFKNALQYQYKCLEIFKTLNDNLMIAKIYGTIGITYDSMLDFPKSIDFLLKSLKIIKEVNNLYELSTTYGNLGNVYKRMGNQTEAIKYYLLSAEIANAVGDDYGLSMTIGSLGSLYLDMGEYDNAELNLMKSFDLMKKTGNIQGEASTLGNLGIVYLREKKYQKAIEILNESIKIKTTIGDNHGIANSWNSLSQIYYEINDINKSLEYANKCLSLAYKIGLKDLEKDVYLLFYKINKSKNQKDKALDYYEKYIAIKQEIDNELKQKEIARKEIQYEFDLKSKADSIKHSQEKQLKDTQIRIQKQALEAEKMQKYSLYGGLLIVLVFAGFIYNRFQITQKQKEIITLKEEETQRQKYIVEAKNHEITQSIQYAQKIQSAILPSEEMFKNTLPNSFILFKPKDIVSGDFYWLSDREDYVFYATADSTGHGVPGGFMSMLGTALLNEIIDERKIKDCGEVLTLMREKIMQALKQTGDSESKDGMDMVLIRIDKKTLEMEYAAANNSFYLVSNKQLAVGNENCKLKTENCQLLEMPCDKMPVGVYHSEVKPFNTFKHQLQKGDIIYTYTDGYADQFGGEKGKKYTYKRLREKLLAISEKPLAEQKLSLESEFEKWKSNQEQVDDVCLIGVKV
jgi:tetratricopeptide (TPR) repeat protein